MNRRFSRCCAFNLVELSVIMAVSAILISVTAYGFISYNRINRGLNAAADLRQVWVAQKAYVIKHLDDPTNLRLSALTLATLRSEGFIGQAALMSEAYGTITVTSMPASHSMDGADFDEAKTTRTNGDYLYDVGPE